MSNLFFPPPLPPSCMSHSFFSPTRPPLCISYYFFIFLIYSFLLEFLHIDDTDIQEIIMSDEEILSQVLSPPEETEPESVPSLSPITYPVAATIFSQALSFLYQEGTVVGASAADINIIRRLGAEIQRIEVDARSQTSLDRYFHD